MKLKHFCLTSILLSTLTPALHAAAQDNYEILFRRLLSLRQSVLTSYEDKALIVKYQNSYRAALMTVETPGIFCAYAPVFSENRYVKLGTVVLEGEYFCEPKTKVEVYNGDFSLSPCEVVLCKNPAVGVGNMMVKSNERLDASHLPEEIEVVLSGQIFIGSPE